jgi:NADH:ubiquinone oxidoreductase subunit F (NADH-binding)
MTASATGELRFAPPEGVARLLAAGRADGRPVSLAEHQATYGPLPLGRELIELVEASRLRGRGGGSFPTGQKLRAVAGQRGRPVVVVNAAEGEPASKKDKALLQHVPHLVLDGAAAAAAALGARSVVVAIGGRAPAVRAALTRAIAERRDRVRWTVTPLPDGFVVGEETALLAAVAGRAAKPTTKPPYPFESGVGGAPTLVQNVETLAHLALVARFGPEWFRSLGTEAEPGTALVTLAGAVARPGVYEIELGTRLSELMAEAGGATEPIGAFLVGGYFGGWTRDGDCRLTAANGLGAGVVVALPAQACGLRESARVARYLADQSAGQCGPCVHGLAALADGLERLAHGRGGDRGSQLARWASEVAGRGACRHPDGAANFVTSTLSVFEAEVARHLRHGACGGSDRGILPVGADA